LFWFPDLLEAATEKHHTDGFENQRDQQNQTKLRHNPDTGSTQIAESFNDRLCI
jgi:hypothetical protein